MPSQHGHCHHRSHLNQRNQRQRPWARFCAHTVFVKFFLFFSFFFFLLLLLVRLLLAVDAVVLVYIDSCTSCPSRFSIPTVHHHPYTSMTMARSVYGHAPNSNNCEIKQDKRRVRPIGKSSSESTFQALCLGFFFGDLHGEILMQRCWN